MYGGYLSFTQLKDYLKMLIDNGMLAFDEEKVQYKTTETGLNFIKMYEPIGQMFESR